MTWFSGEFIFLDAAEDAMDYIHVPSLELSVLYKL